MSGFRPKKEVSSETSPAAAEPADKTVHETSVGTKRIASALRKVTLLAILILTIGWVFGVRFHPDALKPVPSMQADTVLELKSGQSVAGKIVSERADGIVFLMEGSEVPFSRNEIENLRPATPEEAAFETIAFGKRPFITVRPEDTFQYKLKNNKKLF
jgi:hypothetical protein